MSAPIASQGGKVDRVGDGACQTAMRLLVRVTAMPELPEVRIGCDVCNVAKLGHQLSSPAAERFLAANFTTDELTYCADRVERVAARWAAKEAVAKAIGSGFRKLRPSDIEVARDASGAPYVRSVNGRPWPNEAHRWRWSISLAHEGDVAIAVAIAVLQPTHPEV